MFNGEFLNTKQRKEIVKFLMDQFDIVWKPEFIMIKNNKDKIYIINKNIGNLDLESYKIDKIGNYFGAIQSDGIRLSIEGSEVIGPLAKKNIVEVDNNTMRKWLKGLDIEGPEGNEFIIIKYKDRWLGSGKLKEGKILNYIPKNRRILSSD